MRRIIAMQNTAYKLEVNIPIISLVTFLSYATYIFYELGGSVYFGYPIGLLRIDFSSLVITLIQNSIVIIAMYMLLRSAFRSGRKFLDNIFVISGGLFIPMLVYGDLQREWRNVFLNLILFSLIFLLNSSLKKSVSEKSTFVLTRLSVQTILLYFALVFYIGNYAASILPTLQTGGREIIVSTNGSEAVLVSCNDDGNKIVQVKSILNETIESKISDMLIRNWFVSECHHYDKISIDTI